MPTPTLYLIDDDDAISRAMRAVGELLRLPVLWFSSAEHFLKSDLFALNMADAAGCLIVDIKLPGMSGVELQAALRERACELPVIMISGHADVPLAVEAMRRGALTMLEKPFSLTQLTAHIKEALERDRLRREFSQKRGVARERLDSLTTREREVLNFLTRGMTNKEIAAQLHLTLRAIEDRRARLMRRVGVGSLAELLLLVQQAAYGTSTVHPGTEPPESNPESGSTPPT